MTKLKGLKAMRYIDLKSTLRKCFGVNGNRGSTEIIDSRSSPAVY